MRAVSVFAAILIVLASTPIAGSHTADTMAVGAFAYSGSLPAPSGQTTVVAGLTRAVRS